MPRYQIATDTGSFTVNVKGRDEWALNQLRRAGRAGCTPIDHPAPRWSAYVHKLRRMGLNIETVNERHGGRFPGRHARYVLHGRVEPLEAVDAQQA